MIKLVIFDMDGVLVDSERVYSKYIEKFVESSGYVISHEKLIEIVGSTLRRTYEIISEAINESDIEKTIYNYDKYMSNQTINYKEIVNDGLYELLEYLKKSNINMALASSASMENIVEVVKVIGVKDYFRLLVSGDQFKESKPNPEIYQHTIKEMGFRNEECIIIEDSYYGVLASKRANVKVVALKQDFIKQDVSMADFQVNNLIDVIDLLTNM